MRASARLLHHNHGAERMLLNVLLHHIALLWQLMRQRATLLHQNHAAVTIHECSQDGCQRANGIPENASYLALRDNMLRNTTRITETHSESATLLHHNHAAVTTQQQCALPCQKGSMTSEGEAC